MADKPIFIETDSDKIINEIVAAYEIATGKTLQPAQPERLVFNAAGYRELLTRIAAQNAAVQNLVEFASAPILDYLGQLVGVKRLAATAAKTTITFTLVSGHGAVTIPQGTRVSSIDGKIVFETTTDVEVSSGIDTANAEAICQTLGVVGNGFTTGQIATILDPQAFIATASNASTTAGAADDETDDNLRERIYLAPSAFSNAGSTGAYKFWAKTANANIIDVGIVQPEPGTVAIYPLMADGIATPTEVLDAVLAVCSADKVRPLTDTVLAISPTRVEYEIFVDAILYTDAVSELVTDTIAANLQSFTTQKRLKMGNDIILAQIIKESTVDGIYNVSIWQDAGLTVPFVDITIGDTEFGFCTGISIAVSGTTNG